MIGIATNKKKDVFQKVTDKMYSSAGIIESGLKASVLGANEFGKIGPEKKSEEKILPSLMQYLSPGERLRVEMLEKKAVKIGFETTIRFIYLAKRDVFNGGMIAAFWGGFKQYAIQGLGSFIPDPKTKTSVDYFFKNFRVNFRRHKNVKNYRLRSFGDDKYILNIEEVASIYYMPGTYIKAPGLERLPVKKGGAPIGLPVDHLNV